MTNRSRGKPKPGDMVILTALPPGFLDDLPEEDQRAITEVIGKAILLREYEDGRAVLDFREKNGTYHSLYVSPEFIKAAK